MPIGAPPRQMATRNVGLNPLRTIRMASSIESRSSDWAEMNTFSTAGEALGDVTNAFLRRRPRHSDTSSTLQKSEGTDSRSGGPLANGFHSIGRHLKLPSPRGLLGSA